MSCGQEARQPRRPGLLPIARPMRVPSTSIITALTGNYIGQLADVCDAAAAAC
jgi:hypothetical protein